MEPKFDNVSVYFDGKLVAQVRVDQGISVEAQLEQAWRATQNIEGSWSRGQRFEDGTPNRDFNPFVTVIEPLPIHNGKIYGHRSSMMGDRFRLEGVDYVVAMMGFEKL